MTSTKQTWNPERYAANARFVSDLGAPVVELLAPQPGERILDLGCGDGALTEKLAAMGCRLVGVDGSTEQIEAARRRGLQAYVMDGQALRFSEEFDAVFSNAALHWMKRPDDVIDGVWKALKPGGRFVGELGGHGCVAKIKTALFECLGRRGVDAAALDPWYFPDTDEYGGRLRKRGFEVTAIALISRPTPLPGDLSGWLATFAETFTSALPADARASFIREVCACLEPTLRDPNGTWVADYVRLRFAATKAG